jgi:hypothetical protein
VYAILAARRLVSVTLAPFSRDRGIVVWVHHRNSEPIEQPRVVWDEPPADAGASGAQSTRTNS